jgi:hypothetical protein
VRLHDIYEQYCDRVQFLSIYIREAHPIDGWHFGWLMKLIMKMGGYKTREAYDPMTIEERRAIAGQCETSLAYGIRTYVDDMDDAVNKAYAAHPTRLYLVGLDGHVVYAGGLGPWGFKPSELKTAIDDYLVTIS